VSISPHDANKIHGFTLADQDWIGLMIFKNFLDQDWIGFDFNGSGLDSDWKISQSAHVCLVCRSSESVTHDLCRKQIYYCNRQR